MFFGDAQSESPRVPSPWISTPRQRGSARTSPGPPSAIVATNGNGHSPSDSPLSRSVRLRNAELTRRTSVDVAVDATAEDDDDSHSGSLTSTPLTEAEEDVRIRHEEVDGFFALEGEFDALDLNDDNKNKSQVSHAALAEKETKLSRHLLRLAPEPDMLGNLEYKLRIVPPTRQRYDKLLTQLKWRLLQGGGECTYELGLLDDGQCLGICPLEMRASIHVLAKMALELDAKVRIGKAFYVQEDEFSRHALTSMTVEEVRATLLDAIEQTKCTCGVSLDALQDTLMHLHNNVEGIALPSSTNRWLYKQCNAKVTVDLDGSLDLFTGDLSSFDHGQEPDNVSETTFSLSLDEKATRAGLGFRRNVERKACRYNARNASSQKQYIDAITTKTNQKMMTQSIPCVRLLVEITLFHGLQPDSFIDYTSF